MRVAPVEGRKIREYVLQHGFAADFVAERRKICWRGWNFYREVVKEAEKRLGRRGIFLGGGDSFYGIVGGPG